MSNQHNKTAFILKLCFVIFIGFVKYFQCSQCYAQSQMTYADGQA